MHARSKVRHRRKKNAPDRLACGVSCGVEGAEALEGRLAEPAEGVFVVQDGVIRSCNLFLSQICGYRPEEVSETLFSSFFDAETIPEIEAAVQSAAAGAFPRLPGSARLVAKDGRLVKVRLRAQPCTFSGQPATVIALAAAPGAPRPCGRAESTGGWFACEGQAEEELALSAMDGD